MIKAIIIDDEQHCIQALELDLLKHSKTIEICATCLSAKEGILAIRKFKPDLVFLDVEMPWMNGFEMLEMLGKIDFAIIFTTAYDQFAAKAFRLSAVDYLLKPIDSKDLAESILKAEHRINTAQRTVNIENLLDNMRKPVQLQKIAFPNRDGYEFVPTSSILYCNAEGAYTKIFLTDRRNLLISKALGDIEEMLPEEIFVRIHHSTIINLQQISHYIRADGGYLVMNNNEKLIVSRSRKDILLERLGLK